MGVVVTGTLISEWNSGSASMGQTKRMDFVVMDYREEIISLVLVHEVGILLSPCIPDRTSIVLL